MTATARGRISHIAHMRYLLFFVSMLAISTTGLAEIYKCPAPDGKQITFTDVPCENGSKFSSNKMGVYQPSIKTSRKAKARRQAFNDGKRLAENKIILSQYENRQMYWIRKMGQARTSGQLSLASEATRLLQAATPYQVYQYRHLYNKLGRIRTTGQLKGLSRKIINAINASNLQGTSIADMPNNQHKNVSTSQNRGCTSDFSCGAGSKCVKAPLKLNGVCMKSVNKYGVRQYKTPSLKSVGPNMNLSGQCNYGVRCPIGFHCDYTLKACVK